MLDKTKKITVDYLIPSLRDVRFLGLMVFVMLVLLTSWSGVRIIEVNYTLQKEIAGLQANNQVRQLENDNLKLKNQYLNTDTYLELTARQELGRGAPGEKLILVPKDVALSRVPALPEASEDAKSKPSANEGYRQNLEAWKNFYFHMGS